MRDAGLPVTLIVVGLVWLAWQFRLFPDIDWIIAAGLVAVRHRASPTRRGTPARWR